MVRSRQFTGRIVTVTNDKIFSEPVYNYTDQFPYVWEEISLSIHFTDDRQMAEQILREAAKRHAATAAGLGDTEVHRLEGRYGVGIDDIDPRVYWRLADGWLELTVRFLTRDHGMREVKDAITRDVLGEFENAGIKIASTSFEITAVPQLTLVSKGEAPPGGMPG